jgi:hypothetical protein
MPQEEEGFIRAPHFRRSSTTRYQTIFFGLCYACNNLFFGLCYACNNFGHKVVNCRANNTGIITNLRAIHKGVIQEDLVKHRDEVTIGLNI